MNTEGREILERLEKGQLELEDVRVVEAAARCPELAHELEELREVRSMLDVAIGAPDEAVLEGQADQVSAGDRHLVEASAKATPSFSVRWAPLVAAALLVVTGIGWWLSDRSTPDPFLGESQRVRSIAPQGATGAQSWGEFEWAAPEDAGSYSVVVVRDTESGETIRSPKLTARTWAMPDANEYASIEWWIEWYADSSAPPERSSQQRAARSR